MSATKIPTAIENAPVFDLCKAREKRFLVNLMQGAQRHDHPIPELHALLTALERMWGGHYEKPLSVPSQLIYYLAVYARHAHLITEDPKEWRRESAHEVRAILQGIMESVAVAIKEGSSIKHEDDGIYIDLFRIPQWFYDEVINDQQP